MDFADSPEHAALRSELRRWLESKLPSEIRVRISDFASTLLGPYAMVGGPTEAVPDASRCFHRVLGARQPTIAGGTSEIQRNIISERALGLPKG